MGEPVILQDNPDNLQVELTAGDKKFTLTRVSMGNPHAVIVVDNVEEFDVTKYGSLIENNKFFPNRTNVEFVEILDRGNIKMRVWERGAGETFACGTGACAAAVACNINGFTRRKATLFLKGGELKINWDEKDNNVYMTGIATKVFEGRIEW